jgi:hypothetical protein
MQRNDRLFIRLRQQRTHDVAVTLSHENQSFALLSAPRTSTSSLMNFAPRMPVRSEAFALTLAVEPGFDFAGAEYRALQQNSASSAFQAPGWLDALHRDVGVAFGAEPVTVTIRHEATEPDAGLAARPRAGKRDLSDSPISAWRYLGRSDPAKRICCSPTQACRNGLPRAAAHDLIADKTCRRRSVNGSPVSSGAPCAVRISAYRRSCAPIGRRGATRPRPEPAAARHEAPPAIARQATFGSAGRG